MKLEKDPAEIDRVASRFHEAYERLAPGEGYSTRELSAVPWADVPEPNKRLMRAVVGELMLRGIIDVGPHR